MIEAGDALTADPLAIRFRHDLLRHVSPAMASTLQQEIQGFVG